MPWIVCRLRCLAAVLVVLSLAACAAETAAQDDDEPRPRPGLIASYYLAAQSEPLLVRQEARPTMLLAPGQTPDPRLPETGWRVEWQGTIEILRPGNYQFSARSSGPLEVEIGGQAVLAAQRDAANGDVSDRGSPVELRFGVHPLVVRFSPASSGAELKIFWESDAFGREPLPAHVLGHAGEAPRDVFFLGRLAVEEHSCIACHRAGPEVPLSLALRTRGGPRLSEAGARLKPGWIYHWLANPQALRPEAVMPRLFTADRRGEIERYAVSVYLASRGQLPPARELAPAETASLAAAGRRLFEQTGCLVCHEAHDGQPARATLRALGAKTTPRLLAAFIQSPSKVDPGGRMPGFGLGDDEADHLAIYLTSRDADQERAFELPAPPRPDELRRLVLGDDASAEEALRFSSQPREVQLAAVGRRVIEQKRCTACHELELRGEEALRTIPAQRDFSNITARSAGGCLSSGGKQPGGVPGFGASLDRQAAAAFLAASRRAPATPAPGHLARLTLARLNCTGCHERDGQGGLHPAVVEKLLENQTEQNAEMVSPPPLGGVTEKLLSGYLHRVLLEDERARPWMSLKMPRFHAEQVGQLPAGLAALDGEPLQDKPFRPAADEALIEAGRQLVGARGFGCTKCHDMLGVPSTGTRGPELSRVGDRVNYDWFLRWMTDPQRIQPGTRMPTVFLSGESPYKEILEGDPARQRQAVWAYLLKSRGLPPPEGLQTPATENLVLPAQRPALYRTFLPGTTPRGIAIRFPNQVHLAYDSQACRLAYAWSGEFLDFGPVWNGRGGQRAGIQGEIFWTSPEGFPWEVTADGADPPDFSRRGKDTALGAELPHDGKLHPTRLHFRGYSTRGAGPTFRFELELGDGQVARFEEQVASLKSDTGRGALREATVAAPPGRLLWLHAALADAPPRWETAHGNSGILDSPTQQVPAAALLRLVQQGQPLVLHARHVSAEGRWVVRPISGKWAVLLRQPIGNQPARVSLATWRLGDDRPETVRKLFSSSSEAAGQ